jgi:hypothetical protein
MGGGDSARLGEGQKDAERDKWKDQRRDRVTKERDKHRGNKRLRIGREMERLGRGRE